MITSFKYPFNTRVHTKYSEVSPQVHIQTNILSMEAMLSSYAKVRGRDEVDLRMSLRPMWGANLWDIDLLVMGFQVANSRNHIQCLICQLLRRLHHMHTMNNRVIFLVICSLRVSWHWWRLGIYANGTIILQSKIEYLPPHPLAANRIPLLYALCWTPRVVTDTCIPYPMHILCNPLSLWELNLKGKD